MRITRKPLESLILSVIVLSLLYYFTSSTAKLADPKPLAPDVPVNGPTITKAAEPTMPFMPKMGNETLKAELGNASWKLFHTILARYPDEPSTVQRDTLEQYIHLFAQVYPCGDCARHFVKLLEQYPPQTSSRQTAAMWGCHIHNKVNDRLGHEIYDCTNILEDYDCGCGKDEQDEAGVPGSADDKHTEKDKDHYQFEVEREGVQHG